MQEVIDANQKDADGLFYSYPDVPAESDAISYFPKLGTQIFVKAITSCEGEYDCVLAYLNNNYDFDEQGVLAGKIILKTVRDGKFVKHLQ